MSASTLPEGADTICGRSLNSREGRILATARDLLPEHMADVWNQGFIDDHAYRLACRIGSTGERIILDALWGAWFAAGEFGQLLNLPPEPRAALVALLEPS